MSARWRQESGNNVLGIMTIEHYRQEKSQKYHQRLIITSVRRLAIAEAGGITVWVDGDRRTRYGRVIAASRNWTEDDVIFEKFCKQEDTEMYPPAGDTHALNMGKVREIADIIVENNFATRQEYIEYLEGTFELKS